MQVWLNGGQATLIESNQPEIHLTLHGWVAVRTDAGDKTAERAAASAVLVWCCPKRTFHNVIVKISVVVVQGSREASGCVCGSERGGPLLHVPARR